MEWLVKASEEYRSQLRRGPFFKNLGRAERPNDLQWIHQLIHQSREFTQALCLRYSLCHDRRWQRLGSPTVNTVLIGQDLSFSAPGKDSAAGVVAGVGFDLHAAQNVSLFGAFEATVMSDRSRTAAAKGGLRMTF